MKKLNKRIIVQALEEFMENHKNGTAQDMFDSMRVKQVLDAVNEPVDADNLLMHQGGRWLGVVHNWMQRKFSNGDTCTWGSDEVLNGRMLRVNELERLASEIAESAIKEYIS
jgi:hypothetical protein